MKNKRLIIENLLAHDTDFQVKCLEILYERQTLDEQVMEDTHHRNEQGFTIADAPALTPIAESLRHGNSLTVGDSAVLSKRLPKYAGQLVPLIGDEEIIS